jgi:hypothetical protein
VLMNIVIHSCYMFKAHLNYKIMKCAQLCAMLHVLTPLIANMFEGSRFTRLFILK